MTLNTYPDCGYGLAFTAEQVESLLDKIITVHYNDDTDHQRPTNIHEALDSLNDESFDWFFIDNSDNENINAVVTRVDKTPEAFDNGVLYVPFGVKRTPWEQPRLTKDEWFDEINMLVWDILPDDYNIEENFVFAQWCRIA